MLSTSLFITSLLAGSVFAAPSIQKRQTFDVKVGGDGLVFTPNFVNANPGDVVNFIFLNKNHTVTQSSFAEPCGALAGGFDSGFQAVANGTAADKLPTVQYTVTTQPDEPVWFYCKQAIHTANSHCFKGMLFAINCPKEGEKSLPNFSAKAMSDAFATDPAPSATQSGDIIPLAPEPTYGGDITVPAYTAAETKTTVVTLNPTSSWTTTYASYPGSPDPTPSSADGSEIKVTVGKDGGLTFDPANVVAKPRDRIVFEFVSKNHTITQSSFAAPCDALRTAAGASGIDSGFMPIVAGQANPTFTVLVNDTTPLYFHCAQTGHCGKGMVFSVNTDEQGARSSTAFQTLAKQVNGTSASTGGTTTPAGGAAAVATTGASFVAVALAGLIALAL
jgi:plastocyanin